MAPQNGLFSGEIIHQIVYFLLYNTETKEYNLLIESRYALELNMTVATIALKKTASPSTTSYGARGVRGTTPASYDILADGEKVGEIKGGCHTRLACKSGFQTAKVKGESLFHVGVRGEERKRMDDEIRKILSKADS